MGFGANLHPLQHHHRFLLSHRLLPSVPALKSGTTFRRTISQIDRDKRCFQGLSHHAIPYTQWVEKGIEEIPKVSNAHEIEQQIYALRGKLQSINDGELSISAYDTAWVALVKDIHGSDNPQFPTSLEWIINNQLPDGSWGNRNFFLAYDRLICTLACVVALKTWNTYPEGCRKGLIFLDENLHKLKDEDPEHQLSGFEVIFPTLLEMAQTLGLQVLQDSNLLQDLCAEREQKLRRIPMEMLHNVPTTLLHSLEGIPNLDWEKLLKLQHPNGSFLCSTSSTAYALMQTKDENCFRYLLEIVERFNGGVPHTYPVDIFERLWVVDRLDRLGFSRYFKSEIKNCLDYVYRFWTPNGISWSRETVELDIDDTSMGFRILRLHGYDVQAQAFHHFEKDGQFFCFVGQTSQGITEMLSLYRASQLLFPGEDILGEAKKFTSKFLRQKQNEGQVADRWLITKDLVGEVKYYLDMPWYASLPRIETRYYIDQYGGEDDVWIAKVLYRMYNVSNKRYSDLGKLDYNHCQELHQREWTDLQWGYEKSNLKKFGLSKDDLLRSYFLAMSSIFEPERATERLGWAQTAAMIGIVSSHFNEIPIEQKKIFIQAFNLDVNLGFDSTNRLVQAILDTIRAISLMVEEVHGKEVYQHLKDIWNTWLLNLKTQDEDPLAPNNEAELLVWTINLSAGQFSLVDGIPQLKYAHLTNITNAICHSLHEKRNFKAAKEGISIEGMESPESTDLQMQELVQHVVKRGDGTDPAIKHIFLTVAKSYYYDAYCDPATMERHIAKVLFEAVA